MSIIKQAAYAVHLPVVQKPSGFAYTTIDGGDRQIPDPAQSPPIPQTRTSTGGEMNITPAAQRLLDAAFAREEAKKKHKRAWDALRARFTEPDAVGDAKVELEAAIRAYYAERKEQK